MRARRTVLVALALTAGCTSSTAGIPSLAPRATHGSTAAPAPCPAAFFGVPGSGEGIRNLPPPAAGVPPGVSGADALHYGPAIARLKDDLIKLAGGRLGSTLPVNYPAIPVADYATRRGLTDGLDRSEAAGIAALVAALKRVTAGRCAARPLLLAGYSQGAEVVVRAVQRLSPARQAHVTVALLGNPSFEWGLPGDVPNVVKYEGLRPALLNGQVFQLPPLVRAKRTIDICAPGDPVCGILPGESSLSRLPGFVLHHVAVHETAYSIGAGSYTENAARFLWDHRT